MIMVASRTWQKACRQALRHLFASSPRKMNRPSASAPKVRSLAFVAFAPSPPLRRIAKGEEGGDSRSIQRRIGGPCRPFVSLVGAS